MSKQITSTTDLSSETATLSEERRRVLVGKRVAIVRTQEEE